MTVQRKRRQRVVNGHKISLEVGARYVASRPMVNPSRDVYQVVVRKIGPHGSWNFICWQTEMNLTDANKFLSAFNRDHRTVKSDEAKIGRTWR